MIPHLLCWQRFAVPLYSFTFAVADLPHPRRLQHLCKMDPQSSTLKINDRISIPEEELLFTASRSGGPGGQNVNKVSTRVTLWFDVLGSPSLSREDKECIIARLPGRVNKQGRLWVTAQQSRSQSANRELAKNRLAELLEQALTRPRIRKKTRVPLRVREERLTDKKKRGKIKSTRSSKVPWEA
jgi:ribosome-associated protein